MQISKRDFKFSNESIYCALLLAIMRYTQEPQRFEKDNTRNNKTSPKSEFAIEK